MASNWWGLASSVDGEDVMLTPSIDQLSAYPQFPVYPVSSAAASGGQRGGCWLAGRQPASQELQQHQQRQEVALCESDILPIFHIPGFLHKQTDM